MQLAMQFILMMHCKASGLALFECKQCALDGRLREFHAVINTVDWAAGMHFALVRHMLLVHVQWTQINQ
jgi:hypothetical protein